MRNSSTQRIVTIVLTALSAFTILFFTLMVKQPKIDTTNNIHDLHKKFNNVGNKGGNSIMELETNGFGNATNGVEQQNRVGVDPASAANSNDGNTDIGNGVEESSTNLGQIESTDAILDSDDIFPHSPVNTSVNDATSTTSPFPLKPPFRILQWGIPRTGSTFQTHLLHAIVSIKAPKSSNIQVISSGYKKFLHDDEGKSSFVIKTHMPDDTLIQMAEQNTISIFTSNSLGGTSNSKTAMNDFSYPVLYTQMKENLLNCSLCEVDQYTKIFDLTKKEVEEIKQYMKYYEIIRRCCGYQMSKYEMKRLNGCNMTKYRSQPDYPNCEAYNKSEIEILFVNNPGGIKHYSLDSKYNWVEVGDCKRMDESIATGLGFNKKEFKGCDENW